MKKYNIILCCFITAQVAVATEKDTDLCNLDTLMRRDRHKNECWTDQYEKDVCKVEQSIIDGNYAQVAKDLNEIKTRMKTLDFEVFVNYCMYIPECKQEGLKLLQHKFGARANHKLTYALGTCLDPDKPNNQVSIQQWRIRTVLHDAATRGDVSKFEALLERGANILIEDEEGNNPVNIVAHEADTRGRDISVTLKLLELAHKAHPGVITRKSSNGRSPAKEIQESESSDRWLLSVHRRKGSKKNLDKYKKMSLLIKELKTRGIWKSNWCSWFSNILN